ncbi:hypothetical protein CYY_009204 [Polysphondylium violaceum]|uniref:Uncharacterized protein n=1 Tax=Polysphondylium violaceum TaxID=133409 RepID=A0A8J4V0N8_9MYCE|nr:hypothetical protein CYY_009204 [Polysphondylium violaceum]
MIQITMKGLILYSNMFLYKLPNLQESLVLLDRYKNCTIELVIECYYRYFKKFLEPQKLLVLTNPNSCESIQSEMKSLLDVDLNIVDFQDIWIDYNKD